MYYHPDDASRDIEKAKKTLDILIIGSIVVDRNNVDEWRRIAKAVQNAGADVLELNMHCIPYIFGTSPKIVTAVKEVAKVPVIVKMMVPWEDAGGVAKTLVAAGADALTGMGTFVLKALDVDVENKKKMMQPAIYGLGGSWLNLVGLAYAAGMASSVKVPISGVSGVASWKDVVKYIMVEATTVQVCGAIFAEGCKVIGKLVKGLEKYMEENGYQSIEEFKGIILKDMISRNDMACEPPIKAAVDKAKCRGRP